MSIQAQGNSWPESVCMSHVAGMNARAGCMNSVVDGIYRLANLNAHKEEFDNMITILRVRLYHFHLVIFADLPS